MGERDNLDFVRKSKLPLKKLYTLVSHFLKRIRPNKQAKKKGRPQKYEDALIITLWLFRILNSYSYREPLRLFKNPLPGRPYNLQLCVTRFVFLKQPQLYFCLEFFYS